jgi:hypothetical protein
MPVRAVIALFLCAASSSAAPLRFSVPEGNQQNEFYRDGPIAAHLVLRSGEAPRIVVAFPAGNSGAALWLDAGRGRLEWNESVHLEPAERRLADGATLRGIRVALSATGGPVVLDQALTGSIRTIRDYEYSRRIPAGIEAAPRRSGRMLTWQRRRLDGAAGYWLEIEVLTGSVTDGANGGIVLAPDNTGRLRLVVTALTGDAPLVPIERDRLFTDAASADPRLRNTLAFLAYEEKLLAGSWRFNTYFGRDTLMTLRLLAPALSPAVVEAGLESVLARLSPDGEVAHEEDIGEFAVLRRRASGEPVGDAPLYDYKMVDDDFMLAVVAAHYLLDSPEGRGRAESFLARAAASGERRGSALARNLRFVIRAAAPFAREPGWRNLIALKLGERVGNWRDSEVGLGGGRYPFDVNAVLVPAALDAVARLERSGLLDAYVEPKVAEALRAAGAMAGTWRSEAPRLFDVRVSSQQAIASLRAYAEAIRINPAPALAAVGADGLRFRAVALDAEGAPVAVQSSDEALALLFLEPEPAEVARIVRSLTRAFPAGLLTGAGLVVANPAFADRRLWPSFTRDRYHGTVVWSWQQALLRAGIDRQLARGDLPGDVRTGLAEARERLEEAMRATGDMRGAELWSWSQSDGRYRVEPFGQRAGHETESNAAQLWSTVHLLWR